VTRNPPFPYGEPDRFGVPARFFGAADEDFYAVLGRVVMVAALLEDRLLTLLTVLAKVPQGEYAGVSFTRLSKETRKALRVRPTDYANQVIDVLDRLAVRFEQRNELVHSLWPSPTLERAWGHRAVTLNKRTRPGDFEVTVETNGAELTALLVDMADIYNEIRRLEDIAESPNNQVIAASSQNPPTIRPMTIKDWPAVEAIYSAGIATGDATFETEPPSWETFDQSKLADHRHVAVDGRGEVIGWAAAVAVSDRRVYSGVVEHSVYVQRDAAGRGVGTALLNALIASTEAAGIWTIQSGVFPENVASLGLHKNVGFRTVGIRKHVGQHNGTWRSVELIERRSPFIS